MRRKFIDENGRIFGFISVIDIAVIIIVAVLAAAIYVKFNVKEATSTSAPAPEMTYKITIVGARESVTDTLRNGDALFNRAGNQVGTITNVETEPSTSVLQTTEGKFVEAVIPERYDVIITLTAPCSESGGRYYAYKNFELSINSYNEFYTKYNSFSAYTTEIG